MASDDSVLSALAGFSSGLSSSLVPLMAAKYKSRLAIQEAEKARELRKVRLEDPALAGDLGLDVNKSYDPEVLSLYGTMKRPVVPTYMVGPEGNVTGIVPGKVSRAPVDKTGNGNKPSLPGQKSLDIAFGKEYSDYIAGGGFADTQTQLRTLNGVLEDLKTKKNLTGPTLTAQPDFTRKRLFPESFSAQQAVEQSVQRTLKQTLGGQFTEREGALFMRRGYDPELPQSENVKKLSRAISQLEQMAKAKKDAVEYFEEHGTLVGFKGNLPSFSGNNTDESSGLGEPSLGEKSKTRVGATQSGLKFKVVP